MPNSARAQGDDEPLQGPATTEKGALLPRPAEKPPYQEGPANTLSPARAKSVLQQHPGVSPREFKQLLKNDPEYSSARGRRLAGILVTSIGGGGGLFFGLIGLVGSFACLSGDCSDIFRFAIGSFVFSGVSMAVGLPLWITGHRHMNEVRDRKAIQFFPQVSMVLGSGNAAFNAAWRF